MDKVTTKKFPGFAVIVHDVRSILNVGSIFRIADGAGVDMVYLTGYTPGPDTHPGKMAKTALGAEKIVPWHRIKRIGDLLKRLHEEGFQTVALEQHANSIDYRAFKPKFPLALILGNEVKGVAYDIMRHGAVKVISIPMRGSKESLNVAVAFGIAAYEITRRRNP